MRIGDLSIRLYNVSSGFWSKHFRSVSFVLDFFVVSWYSIPFNKLCPRRNIVLILTKSLALFPFLSLSHSGPFIFVLLFCGDCTCVKLVFVFRCLDYSLVELQRQERPTESYTKYSAHTVYVHRNTNFSRQDTKNTCFNFTISINSNAISNVGNDILSIRCTMHVFGVQ